jgi:rfaE bifunctional protein kinase chain/domain
MFSRARLLQIADAMQGRRVVVWGDIVADRFIYGLPKRISREAPVLILRQYREDVLLGGGGNAIHNIAALGGVPIPVGVLGEDAEGRALVAALTERGVDCGAILRLPRYRTPTKTRVLGGMPHAARQQIVRYDLEDFVELDERERETIARTLAERIAGADAALISDYGYGSVSPELATRLNAGRGDRPVTLDSRYRLLEFNGVTAATPNEDEAAIASGISLFENDEDEKLRTAGLMLLNGISSDALLITRGSRGMALFERGSDAPLEIPVWGGDQVADVTGAGDTVIAAFTLALAARASFAEAAKIANYCGGVVVMKMGTATASVEELRDAIARDEGLRD